MIPVDKVREIVSKHKLLERELSSDKIDKKKFAKISKEYSDLNEVLDIAKQYLSFDEILVPAKSDEIILSVNLPFKIWSKVAMLFASIGGWISPHLIAGKRFILFVIGAIADAKVSVSCPTW